MKKGALLTSSKTPQEIATIPKKRHLNHTPANEGHSQLETVLFYEDNFGYPRFSFRCDRDPLGNLPHDDSRVSDSYLEAPIVKWVERALALAIVIVIGWLFLSPPTLRLNNTNETVSCQALGWEMPGSVSLLSQFTDQERATIERYLRSTGAVGDDAGDTTVEVQQATALADGLCQESRQNRQTTLVVVVGASLALLVWLRTRRRAPATAQNVPISSDPAPKESDNGRL